MHFLKKHFLLIFILFLALAMRLPHLNGSFWLDESAQVLESSRPFSMQYQIRDDFQPPLFHYVIHFMLMISRNEAWLRSTSIIASLLTIIFLYFLLLKKEGKVTAVLAAIFLATSSFHIFYSQELRPYAFATLFATASWYALLCSFKTQRKYQLLYIISTVSGLYSMYLYPFIFISEFFYIFILRKSLRKTFIITSAISFLFFIPWLPFFFGQLEAGTALTRSLPGWSTSVAIPQLKALPLTLLKFFLGQVELQGNPLRVLVSSIPVLFFFYCALVSIRKKKFYLLFWFFIPIILVWLVSFIVPVIAPKRLMIILPALFSILAVTISTMHSKLARNCSLCFILAVNIITSYLYFTVPKYQREDWRDVIAIIQNKGKDKDARAMFAFPEPFAPWRLYSNGTVRTISSGVLQITSTNQLTTTYSGARNSKMIFLFDYLRDLSDPNHLSEKWLAQSGFHQTSIIDGGNIGFIRIYQN